MGFFESLRRSALTTNLPLDISRDGFIQAWRERLAKPASIPPVTVASGPVLENVFTGDDIDLFKFPVPFWHERDGGRYIGTGHVVITRDPDEGWVNVGCYRVMVHDRNTMGMNISPGKHGRMHRQKYFDRGKPCPVVCCFGVDPLLHMIATRPEPYGRSEFDAVGGIKGEPVEVIARRTYRTADSRLRGDRHRRRVSAGPGQGRRAVQRMDRLLRQRRENGAADQSPSPLSSQRSDHHRVAGISADGAGGALL